ncbi:unnamed protein product [Alopecurus aequalis]
MATEPMPIWSSLPDDPVMEVGGHILATGDVDYYVNMRAIPGWRAAMDDPKACPTDPRFLLRQWVMLEEERGQTSTFGHLFLHTATRRFLHIKLPGLVDYYFVISTGGLLILASRRPPHTVCVVNPLTASCIKFRAPMPDFTLHATTAHLLLAGTTPTLILEHPSRDMAYSASPDDEHFAVVNYSPLHKAHNTWGIADDTLDDQLSRIIAARSWEKYHRCHFLESDGEMLLVVGRKYPGQGMEVFKMNFKQKLIEPMKSIGSRALFLGDRCVSVDAHKILSTDGNRIFYRGRDEHGRRNGIYMYDLTTEKEEFITSELIELFGFTGNPVAPSIIQLLVNYCTNIQPMEPATE